MHMSNACESTAYAEAKLAKTDAYRSAGHVVQGLLFDRRITLSLPYSSAPPPLLSTSSPSSPSRHCQLLTSPVAPSYPPMRPPLLVSSKDLGLLHCYEIDVRPSSTHPSTKEGAGDT